jgi:hypothetical protein
MGRAIFSFRQNLDAAVSGKRTSPILTIWRSCSASECTRVVSVPGGEFGHDSAKAIGRNGKDRRLEIRSRSWAETARAGESVIGRFATPDRCEIHRPGIQGAGETLPGPLKTGLPHLPKSISETCSRQSGHGHLRFRLHAASDPLTVRGRRIGQGASSSPSR